MKKEERIKVKTLADKACDMFDQLHIDRKMGQEVVHTLTTKMAKTQKPMPLLGNRAVEFFKGKMGDKHTPILLSVYCLLFSRILLDPGIGVVTMTEDKKKGDNGDEKERTKDTSK